MILVGFVQVCKFKLRHWRCCDYVAWDTDGNKDVNDYYYDNNHTILVINVVIKLLISVDKIKL